MPFIPTAPVRIQPYLGYRNARRLQITARALRSRDEALGRTTRWQAARAMLAQFASHEVADLAVEIEIARPDGRNLRHTATTDGEGFVSFDVALETDWTLGPDPLWETVRFHWTAADGPCRVEGHVLAPGSTTRLGVISDIDDTIIETGITGDFRAVLRNWRRVLVEMPEERILVPGADVFYNALGGALQPAAHTEEAGARQSATARPFFYVSSSPWNLFSYLVTYIRGRGLPLGPILLRDWGLNRATFGSASHGAHKQAAIAGILGTYPEMRFALIGDDSQGDLTAYAQIAREFPGRIKAIFIRKVGEAMSAEELAAQATIEAAGIPLWLGDSYATGHDFLATTGLLDGEAEAIVAAVETAGKAKA